MTTCDFKWSGLAVNRPGAPPRRSLQKCALKKGHQGDHCSAARATARNYEKKGY